MATAIRITYDPEGDILFVTFGSPAPSTGYQVADQILLRIHPESRHATGLTILNYSVHARSHAPLPLSAQDGPADAAAITAALPAPPTNRFLKVVEDAHGLHAIVLQPALAEAIAA